MKDQTSAFLDKARELLDQAETIFGVGLNEPAGRTAYLAGFHAAQALIFEISGRIHKSHAGVQQEFSRLVKDDRRVDDPLRAFLGRAYSPKALAAAPVRTSRPKLRAMQSTLRGVLWTA